MAAPRLNGAPERPSENSRRQWKVFAVRLTEQEREWLERAAASKYPQRSRPLGRFMRWALGLAFDEVLGRRR